MSKWDKLLTKICALSKDLRFDELRKVLESAGKLRICDECPKEWEQPLYF